MNMLNHIAHLPMPSTTLRIGKKHQILDESQGCKRKGIETSEEQSESMLRDQAKDGVNLQDSGNEITSSSAQHLIN